MGANLDPAACCSSVIASFAGTSGEARALIFEALIFDGLLTDLVMLLTGMNGSELKAGWKDDLPCRGKGIDEAISRRDSLCGAAVFKEERFIAEGAISVGIVL